MLIAVDKRGSINLPTVLRKELGLESGSYLNLTIEEGGAIVLHPVSIYPNIQLNKGGLSKLREARKSGRGKLPDWILEEMRSAQTNSE
jgi:AbrB family looped-hinge helix DNA binding protein